MKFIGHLLALLLAAALAFSVSSWIFGQTLWNADYLEHEADQTKLYAALATNLPITFTASNSSASKAGIVQLDPALIQSQLTAILPQFINHFYNSGPAPVVDLVALSHATGQPEPENATTTISLGPADVRIVSLITRLKQAGELAPIAVFMLIGLIVVTMRKRRLRILARACVEAALTLLATAALLWFTPSALTVVLNKPTLVPIRTAISPFITTTMHSIATRFILGGAVFIVLAVALWLTHRAIHLKARFTPKPKISPKPPAHFVKQ